uniref:Uncharacterized protein n=1 Tax=Salix viminalis TaxID=40686 RepID=A0A6N2KVI2_SALVM
MNYQSLMTRSEAVVDVFLITMQGDGGHNLRQSGSIQQGHHHHHFMVVISILKEIQLGKASAALKSLMLEIFLLGLQKQGPSISSLAIPAMKCQMQLQQYKQTRIKFSLLREVHPGPLVKVLKGLQ